MRDLLGVQWLGDFSIEPLLQVRVVGVAADFGADHLLLVVVDAPVGLGSGNQSPQHCVAMGLDLWPGEQLVNGLRRLLRG